MNKKWVRGSAAMILAIVALAAMTIALSTAFMAANANVAEAAQVNVYVSSAVTRQPLHDSDTTNTALQPVSKSVRRVCMMKVKDDDGMIVTKEAVLTE